MANKTNYFQELKRRKVFTSVGLYAFTAFIIMQVINIIVPALELPVWTDRLVLVLLILGFPIFVIFAWIYDRTPKGFVKTDSSECDIETGTNDGFPRDANGNSTIVYIDIVDFTKLMDEDEKKAIALVHYKHKIILPFVEKYDGLIKRVGDGTLCIFSDPAKAVSFGLEVLQMWKGISPVKLKVGIHYDHVVVEHGEVLGKGINFTSKIKDFAQDGGICLSQAIQEKIQDRPDIHAVSMGKKNLEGSPESNELYSVTIPEKFVSMDSDLGTSSNQPLPENKVKYGSLIGWTSGILIIIFLLFQGAQLYTKQEIIAGLPSIAVFPFENISKDDEFDFISDGLAQTLTFKLSEISSLSVIDQLQVIKAIEQVQPQQAGVVSDIMARKAAEAMDINLLLLGSFQRHGDEILVTTKLVDGKTGVVKPVVQNKYSASNILDFQIEVTNDIIKNLRITTQ